MNTWTVAQIAQQVGGEVSGRGDLTLTGLAPADEAKDGDLTFAESEDYFKRAEQSAAAAILVDRPYQSNTKTIIRVRQARLAFAQLLDVFFPEPVFEAGVHPSAVVADTAEVDPTAHIGARCTIGERCRIGAGAVVQPGCHLGSDCRLGDGVRLFANVVLYPRTQVGDRVRIHSGSVIGSDGFGYVLHEGAHRKVPQVGQVIIGEDVEIGANVTIDRGTMGATSIGKGSKIDNLVQIGHNVVVGEHCILVSQVGIAGSTRLGNFVVLGGQVGLAGHLQVADRVTIAAKSGVMHNIGAGEKWFGIPAQPDRSGKRQVLALKKLPELMKRVRELELELAKLKERKSKS